MKKYLFIIFVAACLYLSIMLKLEINRLNKEIQQTEREIKTLINENEALEKEIQTLRSQEVI